MYIRELAQERRENDEWNLKNNPSDEALRAHAVLNHLIYEGEAEEITEEDKFELSELYSELEELQSEEGNEDRIEEIEGQIEEIKGNKIDVYDIAPVGDYYWLTQFVVLEGSAEGQHYAAGDEYDMDRSTKEYVEQYVDDVGVKNLGKGLISRHVDAEEVSRYASDLYNDWVYESPENYIDESKRQLSDHQLEQIAIRNRQILKYQRMIDQYNELLDNNEYDEDTITNIERKIEEFERLISNSEKEIEEEKEYPEGEFLDEDIQEAIEDLVYGVERDPENFIEELGLNYEDFVDVNSVIEEIVDSDGYSMISSYDGNYESYKINNEYIYVIRID